MNQLWIHYLRAAVSAMSCALNGSEDPQLPGTKGFSKSVVLGAKSVLPYCLQHRDSGYIWLNRHYKPLGVGMYSPWVYYEHFEFMLIPETHPLLDSTLAACRRRSGMDGYFFNDGNSPWGSKRDSAEYYRLLVQAYYAAEDHEKSSAEAIRRAPR